jgi:hypothetical protein
METKEILAHIDTQIARLQQVKGILSGSTSTRKKRGTNKAAKVTSTPVLVEKRTMSAEGRAKIAAAQKARWAKVRKATKKAA